ncbi:glycosyltransferase family 1 protein [Patescibacteria group bacterium]|nr:MAG: glycosyltransferase family 1 protein [Patescibacteria group bacterium]
MRVGIDARMFGPRVGGGGLGRYVEQLVNHLEDADRKTQYVLWLLNANLEAPRVSEDRFEKRLADIRWYTLREQLFLAPRLDAAHCDLLHFPHWNVPLGIRTPFVVTIHDLILLDEPRSARATTRAPLVYGAKYAAYKVVLAHAIRASRGIIAVSEYAKRSILSHFPDVSPEKISVVYEGVTDLPPTHYPLPPSAPYILHVGNSYPHKNLEMLLKAFVMVHKEHPDVTLVLAGAQDAFSRRLEREAEALGIRDAVRFVANPDDETVSALYRDARAYAFPSRAEGFGLPGLEAMSAGVPVAAAQAGSLPEVYGDAALYFPPHDAAGMAEAMGTLLTDEPIRRQLRERGRERARRYSWRRMAEETRRVYERAMKA